jgi:hypothetical protein
MPAKSAVLAKPGTVSQLHKFTDSQKSLKMGRKSCAWYGLQRTPQLHSFTRKLKSLVEAWARDANHALAEIGGSLFPVDKGEEQRSGKEALESPSPQRESGDPDWDRRVSFSRSDTSLRVGGVLDCKGARGIRIAGHMCVPIWESDRSTSTSGRGILKPVAG